MVDVTGLWKDSTNIAKMLFGFFIILIFAVFLAGIYLTVTPRYEVLFDNLEKNDIALLLAELDRQGFKYLLADSDTTIKVPEADVHKARLSVMQTGIPLKGVVGFEVFDNSDFGMTEFAQRINYQRAVEGELSRTLMSLDSVKWARVHLVMPEKQLFAEKENAPTASVTVFIRENNAINDRQIIGIQKLVASSVRKLNAKNVTVLDQNGVILNKVSSSDTAIQDGTERLNLVAEIEKHLTQKAREALLVALGSDSNSSDVFVNVDLDFDQSIRKIENIIPQDDGKNVIKNRQSSSSTGVEKGGKKSTTSKEVEYKLGKELEETVKATGTVRRLSVALIIPYYISDNDADALGELIKKVVGFDASRGDQISVNRTAEYKNRYNDVVEGPESTTHQQAAPEHKDEQHSYVIDFPYQLDIRWIIISALSIIIFMIILAYRIGRARTLTKQLTSEERDVIAEELAAWVKQRQQSAQ